MFNTVMRIDFVRDYGNWTEDLVALFNLNKISEEAVLEFIQSGEEFHPDIIIVTPAQFDNVFLKEDNKNE